MSVRRVAVLALVVAALAACGDDDSASTSTTSSTSVPPTTAAATTAPASTGVRPPMVTSAPVPIGATTTSGARATTTSAGATSAPVVGSTSTTTADGPTTTAVDGAPVVSRANGIGPVLFGTDPDTAIAALTRELGAPTRDSGWMDPLSLGSCPGTEVRTVVWDDLSVYFGDESTVLVGRPHVFAYSYGPTATATPLPSGLTIDGGGTIGTTVAALRTAHPAVELFPADPTAPASFAVTNGLTGQLTGTTDADTVTRVQGGIGCGE